MDRASAERACLVFAELLSYPSRGLDRAARDSLGVLGPLCPQAASHLSRFLAEIEPLSTENLEEVYTATFDVQVLCYPYVGYQLFGESYKRGEFMAVLREKYRGSGFSEGKELPDHLPVLLRFIAGLEDPLERKILIEDGLIPAVGKMLGAFREGSENPYRHLLLALSEFLPTDSPQVRTNTIPGRST